MKQKITIIPNQTELEKQFEYVNSLIEQHRSSAIAKVNIEALLANWEVGQYISIQLKSSRWGTKVVSDLADYLKCQNPKRRGFGKRHLYNMVKFYETYSNEGFINIVESLRLPEIVQSSIAQLEDNRKHEEFVQLPIAQLNAALTTMPSVLSVIPFTSHIEIMNRCRTDEERIFYMLYAAHQRLKTEELRRCIVNQTYSSLMDKDKMLSPKMITEYPNTEFILKDKAFIDFLIELKAVDFQPEFIGKMDMYLEALDRDVKRENENPSIGIILCPSADRSMVEYTLSRSLSPTMVTEYQRKLIPQEVMKKSLEEYCSFLKGNQ
ncbi:PDDEXK nuclease domain-containing protein [Bacteroides sp.]